MSDDDLMPKRVDPPWMAYAKCADLDPEVFFPGPNGDTATPKAVCHDCPVRLACLEHAIANDERHGIWGGTTIHERRRIRRQRGLSKIRLRAVAS